MQRLNDTCKKLLSLQNIRGKNAKQAYLDDNSNDEDFKLLLRYRYDIFKTYKIKKLPVISYALEANISLTLDNYISLLDELNNNSINNALRKEVEDTLSSGNYMYKEILEGILTKKLSLGVDTTVKKFLKLPSLDCMLASSIKENTKIPIPCIVEKKYDGVRCIAIIEDSKCLLYTRQGRQLNFPQLETEALLFANGEDLMFDCELETEARTGISGICNHNLKSGYTKGDDDFICMMIFDEMPTKVFKEQLISKPQKERTLDLQRRFANFKGKRLKLGESQLVHTLAKIQEVNNRYIEDGFEGVIVKDPEAVYAFKRSQSWLKMKAINSTTLKVIAIEEGEGKAKGTCGTLVCESSCGGIRVGVGSGLSDEERKLYMLLPPIGKFVEVLFNVLIKARNKDTYSLFHPRFKEMRVDKSEADSLVKIKSEHIGKIEEAGMKFLDTNNLTVLYAINYVKRNLYVLKYKGKYMQVYVSSGLNAGRKGRVLPFGGLNTKSSYGSPTLGYIYKEFFFNGFWSSHKKTPQDFHKNITPFLLELEDYLLCHKPPYAAYDEPLTFRILKELATTANEDMQKAIGSLEPFDFNSITEIV